MQYEQGTRVLTFPTEEGGFGYAENRSFLRWRSGSCLTFCELRRYDFPSPMLRGTRKDREVNSAVQIKLNYPQILSLWPAPSKTPETNYIPPVHSAVEVTFTFEVGITDTNNALFWKEHLLTSNTIFILLSSSNTAHWFWGSTLDGQRQKSQHYCNTCKKSVKVNDM